MSQFLNLLSDWFLWLTFPQTPEWLWWLQTDSENWTGAQRWFQRDSELIFCANTNLTWKPLGCSKLQLLRLAVKNIYTPTSRLSLKYTWDPFVFLWAPDLLICQLSVTSVPFIAWKLLTSSSPLIHLSSYSLDIFYIVYPITDYYSCGFFRSLCFLTFKFELYVNYPQLHCVTDSLTMY